MGRICVFSGTVGLCETHFLTSDRRNGSQGRSQKNRFHNDGLEEVCEEAKETPSEGFLYCELVLDICLFCTARLRNGHVPLGPSTHRPGNAMSTSSIWRSSDDETVVQLKEFRIYLEVSSNSANQLLRHSTVRRRVSSRAMKHRNQQSI